MGTRAAGINMPPMHKQRIFVSVVGFSDVERHALNTVFRLSEDRDLAYAPWAPMLAPGADVPVAAAHVALVDGESAEAVLVHARELPQGQRLIWVGPDAPEQAWRVMQRPIQWSGVLTDLDAVYAARQVDSGLLDLDITAPSPLEGLAFDSPDQLKRALLVGLDTQEAMYLRSRLALSDVVETDDAQDTDAALALIGRNRYCCGVFNLDDHQVDAWSLARLFRDRYPQAITIALSETAGPLGDWWNRRRIRRNSRRAGISALLARPLQPRELSQWMDLL